MSYFYEHMFETAYGSYYKIVAPPYLKGHHLCLFNYVLIYLIIILNLVYFIACSLVRLNPLNNLFPKGQPMKQFSMLLSQKQWYLVLCEKVFFAKVVRKKLWFLGYKWMIRIGSWKSCAVCAQKMFLLNLMAMYHLLSFLAFITW